MLDRVRTRKASHTNVSVAGSVWKSWLKLMCVQLSVSARYIPLVLVSSLSDYKRSFVYSYYRIFAKLYTFSLGFATVRVANSTWTKAHLDSLLASSNPSTPDPVNTILYPPCDTTSLTSLPISESGREPRTIVSLAQFRPEKDHPAQLQALKELLDRRPEWKEGHGRAKLVMIGSCRDGGDEVRVEGLRKKAREFGIEVGRSGFDL
jgi:glycosyltransferase involved in cell wall biosynthesis